jgi:preprotein translocase subunit SecG
MGFIVTILILVYMLACLFLIFVVLLQSGKGGGLSGLFGGGSALSDTLGASGAEKTLNRWTTYCTVAFFVIALLLTIFASRQASRSILQTEFPQESPSTVTQPTPATAETSPTVSQGVPVRRQGFPEAETSGAGVVAPEQTSPERGAAPQSEEGKPASSN